MPQHPAVQLLHKATQEYPTLWDQYARFFTLREMYHKRDPEIMRAVKDMRDTIQEHPEVLKESFNWPSWCWCPAVMATSLVAMTLPENEREEVSRQSLSDLAAIAAWRSTQGIYRIDPTLFWELASTPISGKVPVDVLKRLPEWCVYIEVPYQQAPPGKNPDFQGFYVFMNFDQDRKEEELCMVLVPKPGYETDRACFPLNIPLVGTIQDGILRAIEIRKSRIGREPETIAMLEKSSRGVAALLSECLSVVLYLCADDTDVPRPEKLPPRFVVTKKGRHIMPNAPKPRVHECGYRLGAQLRLVRHQLQEHEKGEPTGRTVAPHIRAAHWHTFLAGPRSGPRTPRVKWLPPIRVKLDDVPEMATLRPVKEVP